MNIKSAIIITTLFASTAISAPALAQDNSVNQILTDLVKQAFNTASNEIEVQIDKTIITAGNMLSIDGKETQGKVSITDIKRVNPSKDQKQSESSDK